MTDDKPLLECDHSTPGKDWMLFDSSAQLAGYASGLVAANTLGLWRMPLGVAVGWMDAIRRKKERDAAVLRADIERRLTEMEKKYFDLVWYARKSPECVRDDHPSMPGVVRIQMTMPEECEKLHGESGDWQHGFNSGCLAAFRFALGLMGTKADAQMAEDEFPFLDT